MSDAHRLRGTGSGFLGEKEILTRDRVKEIIRKTKEYSFFEAKVNLLDKKRIIFIEERDPMVVYGRPRGFAP